jgi:hypothetical protein
MRLLLRRLRHLEFGLDAALAHFTHQDVVMTLAKSFFRALAIASFLKLVVDRDSADQQRSDDAKDNEKVTHDGVNGE